MKVMLLSYSPLLKELSKFGISSCTLPMPRNLRNKLSNTRIRNAVFDKIHAYAPDIFFIMKDPYINHVLPLIKRRLPKTKIVMWYGDQRGSTVPSIVASRKGWLDCLLITNGCGKQRTMYSKFGIPNVHTFYHAVDPNEFKLWNTNITHQLFFGGSNFKPTKFPLSKYRYQLITALRAKFRLVVHGGGWPFGTEKWLLRPKYAKALRKASINIGINHYDIKRYYNRRLFESVASGRLHITKYIPKMELHFTNHKHLVWFTDIDECIDQVAFYLKHNKKREEIAHNGRKLILQKHSWRNRTKQLKNIFDRIV